MRGITWTGPAMAMLGVGLAVSPQGARTCIAFEPAEVISIEIMPGKSVSLGISPTGSLDGKGSCGASIVIPLSYFPTSRLATRPADIARSVGDAVEKLGAKECEIRVIYQNDTGEEIADYELCLRESFEFGARKFWSKGSESYCWEPDSSEFDVMTVD